MSLDGFLYKPSIWRNTCHMTFSTDSTGPDVFHPLKIETGQHAHLENHICQLCKQEVEAGEHYVRHNSQSIMASDKDVSLENDLKHLCRLIEYNDQ